MYFSFPDDKLSIIVILAPICDNCLTISEPMKPQPPVTRISLFFKFDSSLLSHNFKPLISVINVIRLNYTHKIKTNLTVIRHRKFCYSLRKFFLNENAPTASILLFHSLSMLCSRIIE